MTFYLLFLKATDEKTVLLAKSFIKVHVDLYIELNNCESLTYAKLQKKISVIQEINLLCFAVKQWLPH